MRLKKASSIDYVHHFSDITFMKFKPKTIDNDKSENTDNNRNTKDNSNNNGIIAKFKSFLWSKPAL